MFLRNLFLFSITSIVAVSCTNKNDASTKLSRRGRKIYRGSNSTQTGVGFLSFKNDNQCTAIEIGPRCILTARHCKADMEAVTGRSGAVEFDTYGQDSSWTNPVDTTPIIRSVSKPAAISGTPIVDDLALMWVADSYYDVTQDPPVRGDTATWNSLTWNSFSTVVDGQLKVVGYGANGMTSGDQSGFGTKREGAMSVSGAQIPVEPGTNPPTPWAGKGGYVVATPISMGNDRQEGCFGDSGGPLMDGSSVVGLFSFATGDICNPTPTTNPQNVFTIFDNGNDDWLDGEIATFCVPKVRLFTSVIHPESGWVKGTINGSTKVIDCGPYDHTLCDSNEQTATITLTANLINAGGATATFVAWRNDTSDPNGPVCPCNGSTNSTCTIDVNSYPLNFKDMSNIEEAACVAEFTAQTCPTGEVKDANGFCVCPTGKARKGTGACANSVDCQPGEWDYWFGGAHQDCFARWCVSSGTECNKYQVGNWTCNHHNCVGP